MPIVSLVEVDSCPQEKYREAIIEEAKHEDAM
jgi:hypothetical protein